MNTDYINDLFDKLEKAADAYYNTEKSLMSDKRFDSMKDEYEKLSGKKFFVGSSVVSNTIEISHSYENLAGTLDKVNSIAEMKKWINQKKLKVSDLYTTIKYDGHSVNFEFENGKISKVLTRGRDGKGKNLTGYFKEVLKGYKLPLSYDCAIGMEAVISWSNLDKLNKEFNLSYKSPRSAISGIIKEDGLKYAKYLTLIPLKMATKTKPSNRIDDVKELEKVSKSHRIFSKMLTIEEVFSCTEIENAYSNFLTIDFEFMVDGFVIETLNQQKRDQLGYSDNRPNFAIALKFPYQEDETELVDVEWYTEGNTAVYTPVAIIRPVVLNGFTYTNVSLSNLMRFKSMKLHKGDKLIFSLRNEVLGYVEKIESEQPPLKENKIKIPKKCFECGEALYTDSVFLFCDNADCKLIRLGNIQTFIEKMGVKGIKREILSTLYDENILTSISDVINIRSKLPLIASIPGFAKKSANNIVEQIEKEILNRKVYDYEVLGSLNIPLISRGRAKTIFKESDVTLEELVNLNGNTKKLEERLHKVSSIKEAVSSALVCGIIEKHEDLKMLYETLNIAQFKDDITQNIAGSFTICVTGNLKSMSREKLKFELEKRGHKMVSSVTSKTNFLVTNDKKSGTVKNKEAQRLGIPIIDEEEALIRFLGKDINDISLKIMTEEEFF